MQSGRIRQWDTPFDIYHEPADRFVADFIAGTLVKADRVDTELGILSGNVAYTWPKGRKVDVPLRPDDVRLHGIHPPSKSAGIFQR